MKISHSLFLPQYINPNTQQLQSMGLFSTSHSVYVPSQWEMVLRCNVISHWMGTYTEWFLHLQTNAYICALLVCDLNQIVMAKHGGSCVHFSGISTCGRTSRETVSHSQRQPFPTPHKIALPVYVTVTNKRLQPLTTTLCNSLVLSFSLLTTKRRLIKHRSFLCVLRSSQFCRRC